MDIEKTTVEIIANRLGLKKPPSTQMKLGDLGLDSIHIVELIELLNEEFGVQLQIDDVPPGSSVADIIAALKKRGA